MSSVKRGKSVVRKSGFLSSGHDKSSIFWIVQLDSGEQCIGSLSPEMLNRGVDLDEFVASVFADLGVTHGELSLRFILPHGAVVELNAAISVELGPEVIDLTSSGDHHPDWIVGGWAA
jgi:hypothetical protein